MKRSILSLVAILVLLASGLSACYLEDTCSPDELDIPSNLSPNSDTPLDTLLPLLSWSYPEGCDPESFIVEVATGLIVPGEFTIVYRTEVAGSERSAVVGPLEYGTRYTWTVSTEGGGAIAHFIIGPFCTEADRDSYTPPILISPAEGQVVSDLITIVGDEVSFTSPRYSVAWRNSMTCLPPEGFTLEVSDDRTFQHRGSTGETMFTHYTTSTYSFIWDPEGTRWHDCMRLYWRVLIGDYMGTEVGTDPYADVYAISETRSFIINTSGTFCMPDMGLILTPIPWITIPIPGSAPTATTLDNTNCRSGPTLDFPVLSILPAGEPYEIQARNTPGDAWMVFDPSIGYACWVADDLVELTGDTSLVPIIDPLPPSTAVPPGPTAVDCSQWSSDQQACTANPACQWNPNLNPTSPCVNK